MSDVLFFATAAAWRRWLERHHDRATEVRVGLMKRASGKPSITWREAVDQALCFGWIDGVRKSIDAERYKNRFTPRKPDSNWSRVNMDRVAELEKLGLMHPAGRAAFARRRDRASAPYSYENRHRIVLDPALERRLRAHRKACAFFEGSPPGYRRTCIFWIMSAKRPETRERRLAQLIADSAAGRRVAPFRRDGE